MFIELQIQAEGRDAKLVRRAADGLLIGRSAECDVEIADAAAAPQQARLVWTSGHDLMLEPLGPLEPLEAIGGLRVDGHAVSGLVAVREGQKIVVGPVMLVWRWLPQDDWPTTPGGEPGPGGAQGVAATQAEAVKEGCYKVGPQVGRGGMGKVLEAQDTPLRRSVAMKVLLAFHQSDARERFIREARITGKLEHPSIVPVHELNTDEHGCMFYTMKLVKGATLSAILKRLAASEPEALQRFGLPALLTIFQKVCDAVAFAHGQTRPIIHRDLKPDNIMVGDYGEVLVMDWGLAREVRSEDETEGRETPAESGEENADARDNFMTQHGQVMGTPGYMAPEQARGEVASLDERTDIYALGAILHALLTLHPPRKLSTAEALDLEARLQNGEELTPHFLRRIVPLLSDPSLKQKYEHLPGGSVPDSLAPVVLKAMALRPEDRFVSVQDFQREIAAYQGGFATSVEQAGLGKQILLALRRNRREATVAAIALLLLLTLAAVSFLRIRSERDAADQQRRHAEQSAKAEAIQRREAQEQTKKADAAKQRAVASKAAADELIHFMQYDLRDTLGKLGQLKMMEGINARIRRYHQEHRPDTDDGAGDDVANRERAVSLMQQGDVLSAQGDLPGALKSYRECLAICEKLAQQDPGNADWRRNLSAADDRVGDVLKAQGDLPGALKSYRESLAIRERLAQQDLDNADWQSNLSGSDDNVGDVLIAQGDLPGALKSYRESLAIREKLAQKNPDNADWQRNLSFSDDRVGEMLKVQGDLPGAFKSHRESLAIREKLAEKDPDNLDSQRDLSGSVEQVGDVLHLQGDLPGALKSYRRSLDIREKLAQKDSDNADWQCDLAKSYERVGEVAHRQKRWTEAAAAFGHEVEIARQWLDKDNAHVEWLYLFTLGTGHSWELLRDAPADAVSLDPAQVLADLRTARARLQKLKEQNQFVPAMDKNLPWIEKLIKAAGPASPAPPAEDFTASERDADRRLNDLFTTLRKSQGEAGKQALKLEETDWLEWRDSIVDPEERREFVRQRIAELIRRIASAATQLKEQTPPTPPPPGDLSASEKDADSRLNETYTTLRKLLGAGREYTLLVDQTDWLKWRDRINDPERRLKFVRERITELERRIAKAREQLPKPSPAKKRR